MGREDMDAIANLALHLRLLAGDPTAADECVVYWLPQLVNALSVRHAQIAATDDHFITTAAIDALLDYTGNPQKYDPQLSSLDRYLLMLAQGDLRNALMRDRRQRKAAISIHPVELFIPDGNTNLEGAVMARVGVEEIWNLLMEEIDDPTDRKMLAIILDGERATASFAQILEIGHLPQDQQRAIVKRHKDRISKRLERLGRSIHGRE